MLYEIFLKKVVPYLTYLGPRPERPELQKEIEKEVPEFGLRLQAMILKMFYNYIYDWFSYGGSASHESGKDSEE